MLSNGLLEVAQLWKKKILADLNSQCYFLA